MRPQDALLAAPDVEAARGQPRREWLITDVLFRVASRHQAGHAVVDLRVLRRRRVDRRPLVAHAVAAPADVDQRERGGVDLPAVGDRTDPPARRRLAKQRAERARVRLVLRVDHGAELGRARVPRRPRAAVLDVRQRPQPQRVGRATRHRPRARHAQPRRRARERLVLIGERVADDLGHRAAARHRRRAPVATAIGGQDLAAAVGQTGGGVEDRGSPHRSHPGARSPSRFGHHASQSPCSQLRAKSRWSRHASTQPAASRRLRARVRRRDCMVSADHSPCWSRSRSSAWSVAGPYVITSRLTAAARRGRVERRCSCGLADFGERAEKAVKVVAMHQGKA